MTTIFIEIVRQNIDLLLSVFAPSISRICFKNLAYYYQVYLEIFLKASMIELIIKTKCNYDELNKLFLKNVVRSFDLSHNSEKIL